jgi:4-hydroxybutyrate CoA-transferase
MKIGIKYCGGCNPVYLREDIEMFIRKNFSDSRIFYTLDSKTVDLLVVICGCKRACATESIDSDAGKIVIFDEPASEPDTIEKILALKKDNVQL